MDGSVRAVAHDPTEHPSVPQFRRPQDKAWQIIRMIDSGQSRDWIREAVKLLAMQLDEANHD